METTTITTADAPARIKELAAQFERETCGRCGGSGRYSYCSSYGDTCFKCRGRKTVFTRRGEAAFLYFESLCKKPTSELVVGEQVRHMMLTMGGDPYEVWARVVEVRPWRESDGVHYLNPDGTPKPAEQQGWHLEVRTVKHNEECSAVTFADTLHRVRQLDPAVLIAKYEQAIAYQSTLTKRGTPRVKG